MGVSNGSIIFWVTFFINVNSDDLIFDFSVSRHREASADFAGFPIFWQYAELRTNPLAGCYGFPLKRSNKIHSMSQSDQRLEALASLKLTPREAEVLFWISEGKSNHDIGVILAASTGTICKHVEHILSKLNVENRTAAAVIALKKGPIAERSGSKWRQPQTLIAGLIAQQVADLWSGSCETYTAIMTLIA